MHYVNINNIKTKHANNARIKLKPSFYFIQNTLSKYKMNNTKIILKPI
jgi:hypothetical protein